MLETLGIINMSKTLGIVNDMPEISGIVNISFFSLGVMIKNIHP